MKVRSDLLPSKFAPVTFTVTCESKEELQELWARLNTCGNDVRHSNRTEPEVKGWCESLDSFSLDFWASVDEALKAEMRRS
jgi:predicted 3-demethylubiquinone-9 3-methyltransferase (glyoxalase superfamily)